MSDDTIEAIRDVLARHDLDASDAELWRAARAALAVVREREGWQMTPPKDRKGRVFLVWERDAADEKLAAAIGVEPIGPLPFMAHWARGAWREYRSSRILRPFCWRPLPAPPEGAA